MTVSGKSSKFHAIESDEGHTGINEAQHVPFVGALRRGRLDWWTLQGGSRMAAHLRVYPDSLETDEVNEQDPSIRIRLGDLLPLLAFAKRNNYLWLQDFLEDEVSITPDLYDVMRSFSVNHHRPSA
jgi:hypothetical protein